MGQPTLQDVIRQAAEKHQIEVGEKILETQIRIITASYDKGAAYMNVFIIAGYASFFGLWSLTKAYITKGQALWAALFMCISIAAFVFFQVYQMVFMTHSMNTKYLALGERLKGKPADYVLKELQAIDDASRRGLARFIPLWRIHMMIAVSMGLLGVCTLAYAFVYALLSGAV